MVVIIRDRLTMQLEFLREIDKMKNILRANRTLDGSRRENDAEHSWHLAMMALILREHAADADKIDLSRVLKMALIHDLIEVYAGDTPVFGTEGLESQEQRERDAADKLFRLLPDEQGRELRTLWEEFGAMDTPDSRYAAALDRLGPLLANMANEGGTWVEYNVDKAQVLRRMDMIRCGAPALWPFAEECLGIGLEKGWIRP